MADTLAPLCHLSQGCAKSTAVTLNLLCSSRFCRDPGADSGIGALS